MTINLNSQNIQACDKLLSRSWGWILNLTLVVLIILIPGRSAIAAATPNDPAHQALKTVQISLGTEDNQLQFVPDRLTFEAGQRYKLVLDNPSPQKHYFTAKDFADNIWSQKVEAAKVEVKGAIHELELKPGAIAEWVFIPQKSGTYKLHCSIPGHTEAGMQGIIDIQAS